MPAGYNPIKILLTLRSGAQGGAASAGGSSGTESSYYCSEPVCALWQQAGFMQRTCRAASFWPVDLAQGGACERWLSDNVHLAPEVTMSIDVVPPPPPRWRPRPSEVVVDGRTAALLAEEQQERERDGEPGSHGADGSTPSAVGPAHSNSWSSSTRWTDGSTSSLAARSARSEQYAAAEDDESRKEAEDVTCEEGG